ncbi:MAG: hypothetical protein ACO2O0_12955 [Desulfurococcales archaeon]
MLFGALAMGLGLISRAQALDNPVGRTHRSPLGGGNAETPAVKTPSI